MKTRKYTYTCEHPGSDVIITSDKQMNRPICPLCAAVMRSFYDRLLGVPESGRKDCPWCGSTPLTVFFRGVEGKLLSGRQCLACAYEEFDQVPEKRMDINDLPVEDIDSECSQAGREVWERVSGVSNIRVQGRFVVTETPYSNDNRRRDSWKEPLDG